ncbi:zinc finger protein 260-like [Trachinotus anak]|uniref:zinc finger protein 260-like n=1 Tax=Trachinotus anak TaxID=443729 RepID=UPI0039F250B0
MPYTCAVKTCDNKAKSGTSLSFHRLPVREPERLKLWLLALNIDTNTPQDELKKYIVCSEHFVPGDYTTHGQPMAGAMHRFLTPTAVPTVGVSSCTPEQSGTEVDAVNNRTKHASMDSPEDTKLVSGELPPSLQQCDIKVEQDPILEETETNPQIKEEQVDQCISPDMEASNNAEVRHAETESTIKCEPFSSSTAVAEGRNNSTDNQWNESDGSSSPQSHSIEVLVELEQPQREEKSCHMCGKSFKKDSYLIRHVNRSHKGRKAFKCQECNKEFDQRYQLVMHIRTHTGEKPFICDYCGKAFGQNSSRLAHMRVHTGEKPYSCAKCGKSFATSNHFKFCKMQNDCKTAAEKEKEEEKAFKCFECNKEFDKNHQLSRHMRVHSGERPFSCDFCGKTFTQNSNRTVHMRQHTGEKPYFCNKCGKRFASSHHLKLCTGTPRKGSKKLFRCTTCGRTFHTASNLKVHTEVHRSWQQHISKKLQGREMEEKKL